MPEQEKQKNPLYGRKWTRKSVHIKYSDAAAEKEKLESDKLAVKIRRTSDNRFAVQTRSTVIEAAPKKASAGKPKTRSQRRKVKAAKHKARQEKD